MTALLLLWLLFSAYLDLYRLDAFHSATLQLIISLSYISGILACT